MVAAVVMLVITQLSSRDEFAQNPAYDGRLMHPALLVRSGMSNDEFMRSLPSVFEHADVLIEEP